MKSEEEGLVELWTDNLLVLCCMKQREGKLQENVKITSSIKSFQFTKKLYFVKSFKICSKSFLISISVQMIEMKNKILKFFVLFFQRLKMTF